MVFSTVATTSVAVPELEHALAKGRLVGVDEHLPVVVGNLVQLVAAEEAHGEGDREGGALILDLALDDGRGEVLRLVGVAVVAGAEAAAEVGVSVKVGLFHVPSPTRLSHAGS
jgi:hypothetical protein